MKEEIRRLKCKVISIAAKIRPRLTGHIQYLRNRWEVIDEKLADKLEKKKRLEKFNIALAIAQEQEKKAEASINDQHRNHRSEVHLKPLRVGKPSAEKKVEAIRDPLSEYFVDIDPMEELCKHLTPAEVDQIAEDPKFYFPDTPDDRYRDFLDVTKWNNFADRLNHRKKGWFGKVPIEQSQLTREELNRPKKFFIPPIVDKLAQPNRSSVSLQRSDDFIPEQFTKQRNELIAKQVARVETFRQSRSHKALQQAKLKDRADFARWRKNLENKMQSGDHAKIEKIKSGLMLREEKARRFNERKRLLKEHFDRINYQEDMLVMNEKIKDMCKMVNLEKKKDPTQINA